MPDGDHRRKTPTQRASAVADALLAVVDAGVVPDDLRAEVASVAAELANIRSLSPEDGERVVDRAQDLIERFRERLAPIKE